MKSIKRIQIAQYQPEQTYIHAFNQV